MQSGTVINLSIAGFACVADRARQIAQGQLRNILHWSSTALGEYQQLSLADAPGSVGELHG